MRCLLLRRKKNFLFIYDVITSRKKKKSSIHHYSGQQQKRTKFKVWPRQEIKANFALAACLTAPTLRKSALFSYTHHSLTSIRIPLESSERIKKIQTYTSSTVQKSVFAHFGIILRAYALPPSPSLYLLLSLSLTRVCVSVRARLGLCGAVVHCDRLRVSLTVGAPTLKI